MKSLYHFFRLIRPLNLAVIALTMAVFQFYLNHNLISSLYQIDFLLLVISTLLIAAAGNIINDYFDVKADRINKPDRLIIDVHIKRRVAILMNWIFNSIGLLLALYLSWKYSNLLIVIISFISINLLWFYSMYFKRTLVWGNLIVAFLTGIVPVFILVLNFKNSYSLDLEILIYAGYAFWLNLIREIIKDMADIKGDLLLNSRSLPIVVGIKGTKIILILLYIIAVLPILYYFTLVVRFSAVLDDSLSTDIFIGLTLLIFISLVASFIFLPNYLNRKKYLISSNFIKLAMLFGLLTPLFL